MSVNNSPAASTCRRLLCGNPLLSLLLSILCQLINQTCIVVYIFLPTCFVTGKLLLFIFQLIDFLLIPEDLIFFLSQFILLVLVHLLQICFHLLESDFSLRVLIIHLFLLLFNIYELLFSIFFIFLEAFNAFVILTLHIVYLFILLIDSDVSLFELLLEGDDLILHGTFNIFFIHIFDLSIHPLLYILIKLFLEAFVGFS